MHLSLKLVLFTKSLRHYENNFYVLLVEPKTLSYKNDLMKSLKIPKGQSESVYRRRTNNTMAKRKKYKRTNNDLTYI